MKIATLIFFALFFWINVHAQFDSILCKPNEDIVFAFQLENQQWVFVCKEKKGKYLVSRFGNKNKIELQIPAVLDSTSWKRFIFNGYNRGGGKENAAMHFAYLSFGHKNVIYEVYELWNSEDDSTHCGLTVMIDKKITDRIGVLKSRKGNLLDLLSEDRIKKEEEN